MGWVRKWSDLEGASSSEMSAAQLDAMVLGVADR
jgi:hypothetical protein